ncbi:secondary thiamine-phosphate synthase enzyme YjbQ [Natroniella acetigena]|uniref:secondary thiamine-phosphate synthase enzyme YjbQ n=1 Tax=Natroniella acetigena TaxID=52004 RepID=UPI00200A550B|nr:secondary thiamine-phosphate synthase enzyme YjbQ [Natroniella acetigena]MCK8828449.1 secondary thiamine-phosphate synthase enzyme YjbQ [Natroniella acetigena]
MLHEFVVKTKSKTELIDLTTKVQKIIEQANIRTGQCIIFVPHTTAGITINENADPTVEEDILRQINKVIPFKDNYQHLEGNSAAHIKATLFGSSEQIIIEQGELLLGTWQGVYFAEFDGPRTRRVNIKLIEG